MWPLDKKKKKKKEFRFLPVRMGQVVLLFLFLVFVIDECECAPQLPLLVAGGVPGPVISSTGTSWATPAGAAQISSTACCGIQQFAYSPTLGRLVAAIASTPTPTALAYSDDALTYFNSSSILVSAKSVIRIEAKGLFLAAGNDASSTVYYIMQSEDGRTFTSNFIAPNNVNIVAFNAYGGRYFFSDDQSVIYYADSFPTSLSQLILATSPGGLRRFCFINATHLFGAGSAGSALFSVDGGLNWVAIGAGFAVCTDCNTCFFDTLTNTAYVSGTNNVVAYMYQSTDFLKTWSKATIPGMSLITSGLVNEITYSPTLQVYVFATLFAPLNFYYSTSMTGTWSGTNIVAGYQWSDALIELTNVVVGDSLLSVPATLPPVLRIGGNLIVNSSVTIPSQSQVTVTGSVVLGQTGGIIYVQGANPIIASQVVILGSGSSLQIQIASSSTVQPGSPVTVQIATFNSPTQGTFSNVTAVALAGPPACLVAQPSYQASSLSVIVSVSSTACSGGSSSGLSAGAIAGIAVGCIVAAIAIVVGTVLLVRHFQLRQTQAMNAFLAQKHAASAAAAAAI